MIYCVEDEEIVKLRKEYRTGYGNRNSKGSAGTYL